MGKTGTKVHFKASSQDNHHHGGNDIFPPITFVLKEKPHAFLKRNGDDLLWVCKLNPRQAEKGAKIKVPLPDGEIFALTLHDNNEQVKFPIPDGYQLTIEGKGMPIKGGPER